MNRPLIGVVGLIDYQKESYWMLPGYFEGLQEAGGLPVMLPFTSDPEDIRRLTELCDGFLFTGGQDVGPEVYGAERLPVCGETSPERDAMETELLRQARAADKPVLGICRGIQFINAAMGGTLWQDLPSQRPGPVEHHQSRPYDVPVHHVIIAADGPLYPLLKDLLEPLSENNDPPAESDRPEGTAVSGASGVGCNGEKAPGDGRRTGGILPVNSYHHQAVRDPAPSLRVMAVSEDGIIEGLYDESRSFFWAVQWHPEFSHSVDEASRRILRAFVKAAGRR